MREQLVATVEEALRALLREASASEELPEFALEVPRQAEHGDFACNAALVLAKRLGRPPRELAARLAERLAARTSELERVRSALEDATERLEEARANVAREGEDGKHCQHSDAR